MARRPRVERQLQATVAGKLAPTRDASIPQIVVALLSVSAGLLTKRVLSQTVFAVVLVPGFAFGAFLINYLFEQYAIYPTADEETNVVVASALGTILVLFVLLVLVRLTELAVEARVVRYQFRREHELVGGTGRDGVHPRRHASP